VTAPPPNPDSFDDSSSADASLSRASEAVLHELQQADRLRRLCSAEPSDKHIVIDGKRLLNLASNDYLALSQHPTLIKAAVEATRAFGVGSGASRLVSGTQPIHEQVEKRFAAFKHAEAALLLATGYTANLAALTTLAGPGDLIVLDKLVHASLIDAARASGAEVRTFPHLKLDRAEDLLQRQITGRRLIVTDSVFSMDGDCADLPALCDLADRCEASLIVDEAHGTGVLGDDGSGLASAQGVSERVYTCGRGGVVISTASKALGSLGGIVTASQSVIDLMANKARPFIYSTAVPPAQAAAIGAALDVIRDEPERRHGLAESARTVRLALAEQGWAVTNNESSPTTPIIPLIAGSEKAAIDLAAYLRDQLIFAPAIRPPTVAPGSSRVRLTLRADLSSSDMQSLLDAIAKFRH